MRRTWLAVSVAVVVAAGQADAQRLAMVQGPNGSGYTYGSAIMGGFSNSLSTRFGGAVDLYSDFSGPTPGATSLFIWLRDQTQTLSAAEVTNLQSWISSGRRVAIFGENFLWSAGWDPSFLSAIGGTDCSTTAFSNAPGTPLVSNALTAGITAITTGGAPGCASGGTQLFSNTFASLFGAQQNALALMDLNTLDANQTSGNPNNLVWSNNIADWLYNSQPTTVTPEPSTIALMFPALLGVAVIVRRKQRSHD